MNNSGSARSHPMNGVARAPAKNVAPPDPVPIRLTPAAQLLQSTTGATASSSGANKRKQQLNQPGSSKTAFNEQFLEYFGPALGANKQKDGNKNPTVIEIPDDDQPPVSRSSVSSSSSATNPAKVVKKANMGIYYPPETQVKGTPVYLPDLPEGTSINKIPKQSNAVSSSSQVAPSVSKQNSATISVVPNKQMQQRSPSTAVRPSVQIVKTPNSNASPASGVKNVGNVTITPTHKVYKPMPRTQPPISTAQNRTIPSASASTSAAPPPPAVKKVVQQITQNSRGNTSITPLARPSNIPSLQNHQGLKRKEPPNTSNAVHPIKMIRLNPNLQKKI